METDMTYRPQPIGMNTFARSNTDIIMPFHGETQKVVRLIESIIWSCRSNPYLITVVDDGSNSKEFQRLLQKVPQTRYVANDGHLGFGSAISKGLSVTRQPWVMFMQSDCVVKDVNWMVNMGQCIQKLKVEGVKMVSARTNNPTCGDPRVMLESASLMKADDEDIVLEDTYLPFVCTICHRELFRHTGPLPKYPFAGGEAEEFAARMRSKGFKQAICGSAWVYHEGGCTIKELARRRPDVEHIVQGNIMRGQRDAAQHKKRVAAE